MKFLASVPTAVKVGGAGVLGGGGIVGTGLLINDRMNKSKIDSVQEETYKLTEVDNQLILKNEVTFTWDDNFSLDDSKKTITLSAKTTPDSKDNNSWTCTIKGVFSGEEGVSFNGNLESTQKDKFTKKLSEEENKKKHKDGFIKSCARNRLTKPESNAKTWSSDLILPLTKSNSKYEFSDTDISKVFTGEWENPKQSV